MAFGSLGRDNNGTAIQTATSFVTQDGTATPKVSPLAYDTTVTALVAPAGAVQLILAPSSDLRVSEDSAVGRYYRIPGGSAEALPVAPGRQVYVRQDIAGGTVSFRFALV